MFCFISNPENFDSPLIRNHKPKEIATADSIMEMFPDFTWILDKRVKDGCSRRRPDLLLDMATHLIIIEIDEKRHGGYSCEHKRMMELLQDCSVPIEGEAISIPIEGEEDVQITTLARPMVFIRFNPDGYTTPDGVQVKSPWVLKSNGLVTIRDGSNTEWYKRLDTLNEQIAHWVENCPEKTVEVVHLFY